MSDAGAWVAAALLTPVVVIAAVTDWRDGKVYNKLTFPAILAGLIWWTLWGFHLQGGPGAMDGFLRALVGFGSGALPFAVLYAAGGLHGGDVKLMAAVGAADRELAGGLGHVGVRLRRRRGAGDRRDDPPRLGPTDGLADFRSGPHGHRPSQDHLPRRQPADPLRGRDRGRVDLGHGRGAAGFAYPLGGVRALKSFRNLSGGSRLHEGTRRSRGQASVRSTRCEPPRISGGRR